MPVIFSFCFLCSFLSFLPPSLFSSIPLSVLAGGVWVCPLAWHSGVTVVTCWGCWSHYWMSVADQSIYFCFWEAVMGTGFQHSLSRAAAQHLLSALCSALENHVLQWEIGHLMEQQELAPWGQHLRGFPLVSPAASVHPVLSWHRQKLLGKGHVLWHTWGWKWGLTLALSVHGGTSPGPHHWPVPSSGHSRRGCLSSCSLEPLPHL